MKETIHHQNIPTDPKVKYVKKARMWVKSTFEKTKEGKVKQKQEWFDKMPIENI